MDVNPLASVCSEIQGRLTEIQQREVQVAAELHWHKTCNPLALESNKRTDEAKAEQLLREVQSIEREVQAISDRLGELAPRIGTLFNPQNWFAKDQIGLRRTRAELRRASRQHNKKKRSLVAELATIQARVTSAASELERYRTFDAAKKQAEHSRLKQDVERTTSELARATERKRQVDDLLAKLAQEMQSLEGRRQTLQSDLDVALGFLSRLSSTDNPYERAMIHQECERRFGEGKPQKIIKERRSEIRQLERDYEKARLRVEETTRTVARRIDTVVVDGNNLCYEGDQFIGLAAVEALLPTLSQICQIVVVFDASIRQLLNADTSFIQGRLADYAKVHVVASRRRADETVLDLASESEFTYVLSNDRFGDFNEKPAIKARRVIRHEIVHGNIFVHDLQLRATYRYTA